LKLPSFLCAWDHVRVTVDRRAADEDPTKLHALVLAGYEQVLFPDSEFALRMAQIFTFDHNPAARADERWRVTIRQYSFAIELVSSNEEEVIAWHWMPDGDEPAQAEEEIPGTESLSEQEIEAIRSQRLKRRAHAHIATEQLAGYHLSRKHHIPTQRIALEDVLRFAFEELGVTPVRRDWQVRLTTTRRSGERQQPVLTPCTSPRQLCRLAAGGLLPTVQLLE
jgi:hypothetical protein